MTIQNREDLRQRQAGDRRWRKEPVWDFTDQPDMCGPSIRAVEYVLARLEQEREEYHILEWGHGGSTYYLSHFLNYSRKCWSWTALDWAEERAQSINLCLTLDPRVGLISPANYVQWPATLGRQYDLILICGRYKAECLEELTHVAQAGTIVLLHDEPRQLADAVSRYCNGDYFLGSAIWRGTYGDCRAHTGGTEMVDDAGRPDRGSQ